MPTSRLAATQPSLTWMTAVASSLLSLPLFSPHPTPTASAPMQTEESYWNKVRPCPSCAQHPPVAPTKVFTMAHRDLHDLACIPFRLTSHKPPPGPWYASTVASCSYSHRQRMLHLQHLLVLCLGCSSPRFLNACLPHLLRPLHECYHLMLPPYQDSTSQARAGTRRGKRGSWGAKCKGTLTLRTTQALASFLHSESPICFTLLLAVHQYPTPFILCACALCSFSSPLRHMCVCLVIASLPLGC